MCTGDTLITLPDQYYAHQSNTRNRFTYRGYEYQITSRDRSNNDITHAIPAHYLSGVPGGGFS